MYKRNKGIIQLTKQCQADYTTTNEIQRNVKDKQTNKQTTKEQSHSQKVRIVPWNCQSNVKCNTEYTCPLN